MKSYYANVENRMNDEIHFYVIPAFIILMFITFHFVFTTGSVVLAKEQAKKLDGKTCTIHNAKWLMFQGVVVLNTDIGDMEMDSGALSNYVVDRILRSDVYALPLTVTFTYRSTDKPKRYEYDYHKKYIVGYWLEPTIHMGNMASMRINAK